MMGMTSGLPQRLRAQLAERYEGATRRAEVRPERLALGLGGSALALVGLSRRGTAGGTLLTLAGGALAASALAGRPDLAAWRQRAEMAGGEITIDRWITIARPAEELYASWRQYENLPQFMRYIETVRPVDERRSHWVARGPAGRTLEWDAEIVEDRPPEVLRWRAVEASVEHEGSVHFRPAPGGRGTEVHVHLTYRPPGGRVATTAARLLGAAPDQLVADTLRRFKQLQETGEIATTEGQPMGTCR